MATYTLPNSGGVTVRTGEDSLANPNNPDRANYYMAPNAEGGIDAVRKNFFMDHILPLLIESSFVAGPFLQGAGAAGTAANAATSGGASSAPMTAQQMYDAGMFAGPTNMAASNMAGALAPAAATTAATTNVANGAANTGRSLANGSSLLNDILTKYAPLGLAGLSAVKGFQQPGATGDLNDMIGLAKNRVQQSEPLFQALNRMAMSGLPNYAK